MHSIHRGFGVFVVGCCGEESIRGIKLSMGMFRSSFIFTITITLVQFSYKDCSPPFTHTLSGRVLKQTDPNINHILWYNYLQADLLQALCSALTPGLQFAVWKTVTFKPCCASPPTVTHGESLRHQTGAAEDKPSCVREIALVFCKSAHVTWTTS